MVQPYPKPLAPQADLGVFKAFCRKSITTLELKHKLFSFSGDDAVVTDSTTGDVVFKCSGQLLSGGGRRVVTDAAGNTLYSLSRQVYHDALLHDVPFVAEDGVGKEVFEVRGLACIRAAARATFPRPTDGRTQTLFLKTDASWGGYSDVVTEDTGVCVAQICPDLLEVRHLIEDRQTYYLVIAPGVDIALVTAMAICFDELKNKGEWNGTYRGITLSKTGGIVL
ncbi:uncharacterized protein LOC62_01G001037 [Vanrija pseudolonga]|uniref:Uncharacterized protein n=1 Tax=Vanrija pseudolonga TaxID=143232 RepID=A0AAF1BN22_9TREE|nr:hypothetical protein LOC62_01G001037 [Vanrija pseudolonga]